MVEQNAPNVRKAVIPGVGHMVNAEAPDSFNRLVPDFLLPVRNRWRRVVKSGPGVLPTVNSQDGAA